MSDRDFLEIHGWTETQEGWINRKVAPFAAPMSLSDAAKIQRILDKWSKEPYEPPKDDLNRVHVRCENCHQKLTVNADWCEANDWPECCGGTMEVVEG